LGVQPDRGSRGTGLQTELANALEERLRHELAPTLELVRLLGRGSAAVVYLAREPALRRLVAVKVLAPWLAHDRKARLRFEREAQAAARISHPNVVTVHWVGALSDDLPYIVMQYVKGRSMQERMRAEGPLEIEEVRRILADLASGLAAAHRQRIVHRDVKPANILFEEETGHIFLTDFGIAGVLASGSEEATLLTTAGHVLGDPKYVSPEQLEGRHVTELGDVYSLGLVGFELASGESPYQADGHAEMIAAHLTGEARSLSSLRPGVEAELERLLARCLERTPEHRPSTADIVRHLRRVRELAGRGERASGAAAVPDASGEPRAADEPDAVVSSATAERTELTVPAGEVGEEADEPRLEPTVQAEPGERLRLRTLGSLDLATSDGRRLLSVLAQPKRIALLVYLALGARRGFKRRDTLLGIFWPETAEERARHALRQALYVLRRAIGPNAMVSRGDEEVGIESGRIWCDAVAFEQAVDAGRTTEALDVYEGDLLPGFYVADAPEFERWLDNERRRLRRRAADAAWVEAERQESAGAPAEAVKWARRAQELTPFDETSLCRLVTLLDQLGDRAGAIKAYDQFARLLESAYDAEPAPETQELMRRVRDR
jgi:serine/threonine-protein kinase